MKPTIAFFPKDGVGLNLSAISYLLEREVHVSAVAAVVAVEGGAVHQLLFTERGHRVSSQDPGALQGPGGGEGPARATLALVLDPRHHPAVAPIHGLGSLLGDLMDLMWPRLTPDQALVGGAPLFGGEVGELVQFNGEAVLALGMLSVVFLHEDLVVRVDLDGERRQVTRV